MNILRVDFVLFNVLGYPMSFIELAGTLSNLACVVLAARRSVLNWPVGILGVILFGALFYQIQLYSDLIEQVYYLVTGFYGWWLWSRGRAGREPVPVSRSDAPVLLGTAAAVLVGTWALAWLTPRLDDWWPAVFPRETTYPFWDAFTTVLSFAAQILMAHRKLESWCLWITVDVIGVWLYQAKGVPLVAILYGVFLVIAVRGLLAWRRETGRGLHP